MKTVTLSTLQAYKQAGETFSCLTAYDASFAHAASQAGIDVLLVGDSLGMVLQGHNSTLPVTIDDIVYHTRCAARGKGHSLLMVDLPFMSNATTERLLEDAGAVMRAGAELVKLEGEAWMADGIRELTRRGVPVCAHLGLTPQTVHQLGGYKVQGRDAAQAERIINDAKVLVEAGASVILLECVPASLGKAVTAALDVPVIGIGAGPDTDGQILVMHDVLGITHGRTPRFVKNFMAEADSIQAAFQDYHEAVKTRAFPAQEHCF
ncbi:3-methyl-2-oxobutanoate hydroxymethyltransferase [Halomonas sp. FeN2]|uniref:3-methyl-2-oxobutanoate hydroxymethyltransferase n=1 Tax=Vreelandella neptunia TaxID=115551 RepID=A0ABZ0YMQ9_9GAMM|nr:MULTISPECIES: 3-methyl-2-oxobutanoate hydroxymethyltransferase [Halomonas]TDV97375.1 3-methyl-2-oxobutanoate hydroxymethyltransferase [Halomonas alkaliantarctica]MBF57045.1 3-methyl-2-oxobutanoate hydroxymethyltransferase [Halomonas sp.]MDN3562054.1 3-methyl-2-oxobutanoate hydroxymethyltransferase [Halomonas neptunia]UBR48352.1 3-methyl-2-oxobutanoate hydroxymethyltransferase [Halomonas sp. FeN2]WQH13238.1 3-methyl-2-oxobutanoate hydroxymethyltransferase [Halomonas neptunia]|tara:strand:- start:2924 stop:3715 length:792 start_codon:yes stop_codon:yes gene_type:complete